MLSLWEWFNELSVAEKSAVSLIIWAFLYMTFQIVRYFVNG